MFWLIKKIFIGLLTGLVYGSNHTKCVSFSNQKCMKFCKTLNDLSNKVWVPNKAEDLDMCVFNMIIGINEPKEHKREKAYIKAYILCECKCKFNGRKCNSDQWWNNDKCRCGCKKRHVCVKSYVWNPATCICENGKFLASIMDDSAIICDEVIESYDEEIKNYSNKSQWKESNLWNAKILYFTCIFINYYSIIDSC